MADKKVQKDSVIPAEGLKMDHRSIQMYKEALRDGKEKDYSIRVMVVGQFGVGKTTLIKRLLGKNVNIAERISTEGIGIHTECCKVSLATGEWITTRKDEEPYSRLQRLVKLLNEHVREQESEGKEAIGTPIVNIGPESTINIGNKENEKEKDSVMEMLQLVNENYDRLEQNIEKYAALSIYDFAGQYALYTTHQIFLTSRAVYLLVVDLSRQEDTDLMKDESIKHWLNAIHSCPPFPGSGIPPVILVGTHVDKIPKKSRQRVIDECFKNIRIMLKDTPIRFHLMDDIAIDNTLVDPMLEELKRRIFQLASQQPHWGEEKPARWLPLEHKIMTLKASGAKVVPLSLMEAINRSGSVRIEVRDEMELFLRLQHEMGTVMYFSVEGLSETIVLDPLFLINAMKSLITSESLIRKHPAITSKFLQFTDKGILTQELIDAIWSKEENPEFHDNKDYIIHLMEKLNVISRPRTYDENGKEVRVESYFLAPFMLRERTPVEIISPELHPEMEISSDLCYVFIGGFLPIFIFYRLLAACIAHWPVAKKNSENLIYCGSCVFELDLHHRLTVFFREHVIFVRVTRTGKTLSSTLCIEVKNFITMTLSNIIGNLGQSLRFELYIQCPRSAGYNLNSLIPVAFLQQCENVVCHYHDESHVVVSYDLLKFWFQERESQGKDEENTVSSLPHHVQNKKPSERQLCQISMEISKKSVLLLLGVELGLSITDIHQVVEDYPHTVTQYLVILFKWQQQNKHGGTFANMEKAFQRVGIDVDILKSIDTGEQSKEFVSSLPFNLLDKTPSERQLCRLSMKIGQEFLLLGLGLGLSWVDIQQIQKDYSHRNTQCLMILVKWLQLGEDRATFKNLEKAFHLVAIDVGILRSIGTTGESRNDEENFVSSLSLNLQDMKPSETQLDDISKKVGQEFLLLGLELGLSWVDIQQIQKDYSNTNTQCLQILVKWQQQNKQKATFQNLEKAFQLVGIDVDILKSVFTGIPLEILRMDPRSIKLFQKALQDGKEKDYNIRVMVVGHFNVGKTTLIKRLLGEDVKIEDRKSTEGIDVHVHCCDAAISTKEWTRRNKDPKQDSEEKYRVQRIVNVLQGTQSMEDSATDNKYNENRPEREKTLHGSANVTIAKQEKSSYSSKNVIDKEKVQTHQQKRTPDSNVKFTGEKHDILPHQEERTLSSVEEVHVAEKDKDAKLLEPESSGGHKMDPLQKLLNENMDKVQENKGKNAQLSIWDFAGQNVYYTTHQTFLTRRAIYILVVDVSKELTDEVNDESYVGSDGKRKYQVYELIEIWLNSIHSCAESAEDGIPPVILVFTHVDKVLESNPDEICKNYFDRIKTDLEYKPARFHLVDEYFAIDNTIVDPTLEALKMKIVDVASQQEYWGKDIPARWISLEQELMRRKTDDKVKVISRKEVEDINKKGTVPVETDDQLDLFLRFLHEIGMIIYFSIEALRDNIVLDPQWMINALKSLINAQQQTSLDDSGALSSSTDDIDANSGDKSIWSDFKEKGILSMELVDAVWTKESYPDLYANKDHILRLMIKLNIIAKAWSFDANGDKVEDKGYLTPCMLRQESPKEAISPEQDPHFVSTPILCYVFGGKFLPPAIFHRLLAACIAVWPVAKKEGTSENLIFSTCGFFEIGPFHRLILYCRNHIVLARIRRIVVDDKYTTPDRILCNRARNIITRHLNEIIKCLDLKQSLQYELHLKCLRSRCDNEDCKISHSQFLMWFGDEVYGHDAPITKMNMNYARLSIALVTVCANALRYILLTHFPKPHLDINEVIKSKEKELKKLQALRNPDQRNLVFPDPQSGNKANMDHFDISLLYTLIRNVSTVTTPKNGWGRDPQGDRSVGASVERIRTYRNRISGHSATGEIDDINFENCWKDISDVLSDIDHELHQQKYRPQLDSQKIQIVTFYEPVSSKEKS